VWGAFCAIGDGGAAPKRSPGLDPAAWLSIALIVASGAAIARILLKRRRSF
jgi:hypothetical protein